MGDGESGYGEPGVCKNFGTLISILSLNVRRLSLPTDLSPRESNRSPILVSVMELSELLILSRVPGRNVLKAPQTMAGSLTPSCGLSDSGAGLLPGESGFTPSAG